MKKLSKLISSPILLHYTMPVIIVYLIIGTVAQKYMGLYAATQMFFAAPVIFLGPFPLPGFPVIVAVLFINLTAKLLFKSPWRLENAGIIITHIGAMLLLFGGLLTALFAKEGYIDLAPAQQKSYVSDYHQREFIVQDENGKIVTQAAFKDIGKGSTLHWTTPDGQDISLDVLEHCRNCKIEPQTNATEHHIGMAQHMMIVPDATEAEDEANLSGLLYQVTNRSTGNTAILVSLEHIPATPPFETDSATYQFILRKALRPLPFTVELLAFERQQHPHTQIAKEYESRVRIIDGQSEWESVISMNKPLRYKGYTLFQSSFIETPEGDVSVLSVVWNVGRVFPYLSGLTICFGLIVHLAVRRKTKTQRTSA